MKARHARGVGLPHALALVVVLLASLVAGGSASGATTAPTFARADYPLFGNNYVVDQRSALRRLSSSARSTALLLSAIARSYARAAPEASPARLSSSAWAACSGW
jgi:hypothetical protein